MGEYALYRGDRIKIGTCEDLYYLRDDQRHLIQNCGDADVESNLNVYRFRFPFPDEDDIEPGQFEDLDRSIEIPGYVPESDYALEDGPAVPPIRLVQQGHRDRELAVIVRDSAGEHDFQCQLFRLTKLEALRAAECFLAAATSLHSQSAVRSLGFYQEIARRMVAGYGVLLNAACV